MYIKYQILISNPYLSSKAKNNETETEKSAIECKRVQTRKREGGKLDSKSNFLKDELHLKLICNALPYSSRSWIVKLCIFPRSYPYD